MEGNRLARCDAEIVLQRADHRLACREAVCTAAPGNGVRQADVPVIAEEHPSAGVKGGIGPAGGHEAVEPFMQPLHGVVVADQKAVFRVFSGVDVGIVVAVPVIAFELKFHKGVGAHVHAGLRFVCERQRPDFAGMARPHESPQMNRQTAAAATDMRVAQPADAAIVVHRGLCRIPAGVEHLAARGVLYIEIPVAAPDHAAAPPVLGVHIRLRVPAVGAVPAADLVYARQEAVVPEIIEHGPRRRRRGKGKFAFILKKAEGTHGSILSPRRKSCRPRYVFGGRDTEASPEAPSASAPRIHSASCGNTGRRSCRPSSEWCSGRRC